MYLQSKYRCIHAYDQQNNSKCKHLLQLNIYFVSFEIMIFDYRMTDGYFLPYATSHLDLSHTTVVKHRIEVVDDIPLKQRHRRLPPAID